MGESLSDDNYYDLDIDTSSVYDVVCKSQRMRKLWPYNKFQICTLAKKLLLICFGEVGQINGINYINIVKQAFTGIADGGIGNNASSAPDKPAQPKRPTVTAKPNPSQDGKVFLQYKIMSIFNL